MEKQLKYLLRAELLDPDFDNIMTPPVGRTMEWPWYGDADTAPCINRTQASGYYAQGYTNDRHILRRMQALSPIHPTNPT